MDIITDLAICEATIEAGLDTFYEVGNALRKIKDEKLWMGTTYVSFEAYCTERWGFKLSNAYNLMSGSEVVNNLPSKPTRAAHVTPLKPLTPAHQSAAWTEVTANTSPDKITINQVNAVALKFRLVEELGADHWIVRQVNDGVMTSRYAWDVIKMLKTLPDYYFTACDNIKALPSANTLGELRKLEYRQKDEVLDILQSGVLDTGAQQIPLNEITGRDLLAYENKLRWEATALRKITAGEKQKAGLPIFDGSQVFELSGDLVYLFPEGYVNGVELGKALDAQGYTPFMVVAYSGVPNVNFGTRSAPITSVNGVKPEPIMKLVRELQVL